MKLVVSEITRARDYNESLILAQNQRWRRASDMQVERLRLPSGSV